MSVSLHQAYRVQPAKFNLLIHSYQVQGWDLCERDGSLIGRWPVAVVFGPLGLAKAIDVRLRPCILLGT